MSGASDLPRDPPPDFEAARWLARLRGPERDAALEQRFNAWLAADGENAAAFDRATDIWQELGGAGRAYRAEARSHRFRLVAACLLAVATLGLVSGALILNRSEKESFRTAHGEQRSVVLSDGTRVALNTDSQIEVEYRRRLRHVRLTRGEALFEVAANPKAPFVVNAMGRDVRALGTAFIVDRHASDLQVTLFHGSVGITPEDAASAAGTAVVLKPGQRWGLKAGRVETLTSQALDALDGWQQGEVTFDHTPLADAIAEMNRYSRVSIIYRGPSGGGATLSGVYHAQDSRAFAHTVAALEGLEVVENPGAILLRPRNSGR